MALDSQKPIGGGTRSTIVFSHNSATSKLYSKIAVGLFFALQMLAGYVFHNFYSEFQSLQDEVDVLKYQLEEVRIEVQMLLQPIFQERYNEPGN